MLTGGSTEDRSVGYVGDLLADLRGLRAQSARLRGASAQLQQTALLAREQSARVRADCRRACGEVVRAELPRDPGCGAVARRLVEEHLDTVCADEIADAKTVVSELANNAFVHGEGRIELRISRRRGRARIEVIDEGHGRAVQAGAQSGWHAWTSSTRWRSRGERATEAPACGPSSR